MEVGDRVETIKIENGQNTEKSPGDLRTLAVTETPALADVKNSNELIIIIIIIIVDFGSVYAL